MPTIRRCRWASNRSSARRDGRRAARSVPRQGPSGSGVVKILLTSVYSAASLPNAPNAPTSMRPRDRYRSSRTWMRLTFPHTTWSGSGGIGMMRSTTHSNEIGAPAMRGAEMTSDGAFSRPSASNSSIPLSNSNADLWTASAWPIVAILTTNSFVSRMLTNVSLSVTPSERGCSEIDRIGGNPADDREERHGRDIAHSGSRTRAHPGDRAGQHAADEQFIARCRIQVCGVDDHGFLLGR